MDPESYELIPIDGSLLGDSLPVKENMVCVVMSYKGSVFVVEPPNFRRASRSPRRDPGFAGNTATNATKSATLETGAEV